MGVAKSLIGNVLLAVIVAIASAGAAAAQTVIDKTVATVDDRIGVPELITYSDLLWTLALQPRVSIDPPTSEDLNRALEIVINQRLIAIEAKRLPGAPPTEAQIGREINRILELFPSTAEFETRLRTVGFESVKDDNFERMMEERVKIEQYLDFRFRSFVVITTEDSRKYYRDVFTPDFRKRYPGLLMPSFEDKQLEINEILSEERVAESLEQFLDDAKQRAEIVIISPV
jgi:hypothetical protein